MLPFSPYNYNATFPIRVAHQATMCDGVGGVSVLKSGHFSHASCIPSLSCFPSSFFYNPYLPLFLNSQDFLFTCYISHYWHSPLHYVFAWMLLSLLFCAVWLTFSRVVHWLSCWQSNCRKWWSPETQFPPVSSFMWFNCACIKPYTR